MSTMRWLLILGVATRALVLVPGVRGDTKPETPVAEFRLQDHQGNWHALSDAKASKLVVVAFLGTECPLADLYADRLEEVARQFKEKGVSLIAIDSNQQDPLSALGRFGKDHGLSFPLLKDPGNEVADRLAAQRTPEVLVLDENRVARYRGRVDDQFALGVHRPSPTRKDLTVAIEELLRGEKVSVPETEVAGCKIGRVRAPQEGSKVTYSQQISRILRDRCVSCHRNGEIAPFALTTYKQAAGWAETIAEVTHDRRMPPWHASPSYGHFSNDARLNEEEIRLIQEWANAGAPEGNPADLPEPAHYVEGWRIPKPDLIIEMPKTVTIPAQGTMPYQNIVVDPKLKHDVWVKASQIRPGNPSVVHHLVVMVLLPDGKGRLSDDSDFLAAYSPGMPPRVLPDGLAKFVPAGSRLLLQVHYTPRGIAQTDRSEVGLVFADPEKVRKQMTSNLVMNTDLKIPPGESDYTLSAQNRLGQDSILYSILPHMHLRGKAMRVDAIFPDGKTETLLDVPHYEFEWQNVYVLAEPRRLPEGTLIRCIARYDNSAGNLSNPDPKVTVKWGEQTQEEMLVGYLEVAFADQDLSLGEPKVKRLADGRSEVTFRYNPHDETKDVYLAGTFNDWKPSALKMDGPDARGEFSLTLPLGAGTHEYKFVLDGKHWRSDPGNRRLIGSFKNSALVVPGAP